MTNKLGALHSLGFVEQAVAGTPETAATVFLVTESISANKNPTNLERKTHIAAGRALPSRVGPFKPDGKAMCELMADTPHPMRWMAGQSVTTQPDATAAPTVYLHTVDDFAAQPIMLTAEAERVYAQARQGDVYIDKLKVAGQAGEQGMQDIEWLGLSHDDSPSLSATPTFPVNVLTMLDATIEIDDVASLLVAQVEFEFDRGLECLHVVERTGAPQRIRPKGIPRIKGKAKFIDYPVAEYNKMVAATTFKLETEFQGDLITGSYYEYQKWTFPACQWDPGTLKEDIAMETITGEADFEAFYDTVTARQFLFQAQNTVSDLTV